MCRSFCSLSHRTEPAPKTNSLEEVAVIWPPITACDRRMTLIRLVEPPELRSRKYTWGMNIRERTQFNLDLPLGDYGKRSRYPVHGSLPNTVDLPLLSAGWRGTPYRNSETRGRRVERIYRRRPRIAAKRPRSSPWFLGKPMSPAIRSSAENGTRTLQSLLSDIIKSIDIILPNTL